MSYRIRPLTPQDIPNLTQINPTFTATTHLTIQKVGKAPFGGWQLSEQTLAAPFRKGTGYDFDPVERQNITQRLAEGNNLLEVIQDEDSGHLMGLLDAAEEPWRRTAWLWNLMLDVRIRRQGYGRRLFHRLIDWATARHLRAILLETQSNNTPACHFYAHLGCQLVGINEIFYTNQDLDQHEVALFWGYTL